MDDYQTTTVYIDSAAGGSTFHIHYRDVDPSELVHVAAAESLRRSGFEMCDNCCEWWPADELTLEALGQTVCPACYHDDPPDDDPPTTEEPTHAKD